VNAVYRVDPDGTVTQLLRWPEIHMPNGIVTSPDNRTLYLIEAHPDAEHHRDIRAYDLLPDGSLKNERIVIDFYPGRSGDGMCIDAQGNLYVAAGLHQRRGTSETLATRPGIHVVSPAGKLLAFRETPEDTVTNCTFGGDDLRTLYVTCGSLLLAIRSQIPGKAAYRPRS
jgi:gluconolactonase